MCTMVTSRDGCAPRSVVVDPARQPMKITRSACSTTARVATTPPLRPTTPTPSGCVSAMLPLPLTVVQTGAFSNVATSASTAVAPEAMTPPPQMNTGRLACRIAVAAASTAEGSAPERHAGYRSCPACTQISAAFTGCFSTS